MSEGQEFPEYTSRFNTNTHLTDAIKQGNEEAVAILYSKYREKLRLIIHLKEHNPYDADDVCQDTFVKVIELIKKGTLKEPEKLGGFVVGVAKNILRDRIKHQKIEERRARRSVNVPATQEAAVIKEEARRIMYQVLDEMKRKDQELIKKIYLEEQSPESICQERGINRKELIVLVHWVKKRFRKQYEKYQKRRRLEYKK